MEFACDLVVALDCILKSIKFQSNLQLILFFWRHFNKCYWDFLTESGITYPHQSPINASQGSETSENIQSLAAGLFPSSGHDYISCGIMAYGSTPYVEMTPKKMAAMS